MIAEPVAPNPLQPHAMESLPPLPSAPSFLKEINQTNKTMEDKRELWLDRTRFVGGNTVFVAHQVLDGCQSCFRLKKMKTDAQNRLIY